MAGMIVTDQWEQLWLPLWPLASNELGRGLFRTSRPNALDKRYIEANPQALSNLLIVDIDHSDAALRAVWGAHAMMPNVVVENPANGHAHAIWGLKEPVTRTEYARRKPLAFAATVTEGLRRRVDGDAGYSGLITKNPEHHDWNAEFWTDELYSLAQLANALGDYMPAPSWTRRHRRDAIGLGRNTSIFGQARTFTYPAAKRIRQRSEYPCGVSRFLDSLVMRPGSHVLFVVPMLVLGFGIPARSGDGSGCRRLRCTQRLYGGQGLD